MVALFKDSSFLYTFVVVIASLAGIGLLIFEIFRTRRRSGIVNQRMQVFVDNREKISPLQKIITRFLPRKLSGSLFDRTLKPIVQRIINYFGRYIPTNSIAKLNFDLRAAGNPNKMHAREFYGLRVLLIFVGIGVTALIYFRFGTSNLRLIGLGISVIIFALLFPGIWLKSKIRRRKEEVRHNLPDALDMLSVCATAGLSFDQGLKKICEYWPTVLSEEFKQALQEMEMGLSRTEALRNLKTRVNVDDLSSFIAIIIQAENIGMGYAEVLEIQSKQMRILRQFRAKEKANALPAKMIIPIVIFIFPAILAIIIGPIIPILIHLVP